MNPPVAITIGSTATALLLAAAHMLAWPYRGKMRRTAGYVIGVSCIGVGMLITSALLDSWLIVIAFVGVALPGGLLILGAWWLRGALSSTPADVIRKRTENARAVLGTPDARNN